MVSFVTSLVDVAEFGPPIVDALSLPRAAKLFMLLMSPPVGTKGSNGGGWLETLSPGLDTRSMAGCLMLKPGTWMSRAGWEIVVAGCEIVVTGSDIALPGPWIATTGGSWSDCTPGDVKTLGLTSRGRRLAFVIVTTAGPSDFG